MNILDYLAWRGDLSFEQDKFNHVDNLILSYLAYVKYDGLVRYNEEISIKEVAQAYFIHHNEKEIIKSTSFIALAPFVLKACANCKRYQNTTISKYQSETNQQQDKQFCAMHFNLNNGYTYIGFRGTDDSVIGWKEDFMISYTLTKAQQQAVDYLNQTIDVNKKYIIGGHSKGGLLAYYGASKVNSKLQDAIIRVYSNDGPGLSDELFNQQEYENIKDKYFKIVPEFSIVGQLFNHQQDLIIIKSKANGVMQHDGMCWQVLANNFIYGKQLDKISCNLIKVTNDFLAHADDKDREIFVTGIFNALHDAGVKNVTDFSQHGLPLIIKTMNQLKDVNPEVKRVANKLLNSLQKEVGNQAKSIVDKYNPFNHKEKIKKIAD